MYCDIFFTSSRLLEELLANGIYGCGTVRQNTKGYPAHLKMSGKGKRAQRKLGLINRLDFHILNILCFIVMSWFCRGDMVAQQQGPLVSTVWLDTKPVTMMATNCQPGEASTVKRKAIYTCSIYGILKVLNNTGATGRCSRHHACIGSMLLRLLGTSRLLYFHLMLTTPLFVINATPSIPVSVWVNQAIQK